MLNPFPQFLMFSFFAPTLLRVSVAFVFFYLATYHLRHRTEVASELTVFNRTAAVFSARFLGLLEGIIAIAFLLGYITQWAAIIGMALSLKIVFIKRGLRHIAPLSQLAYILVFVMCLSLLLSGGGALGFDLPL